MNDDVERILELAEVIYEKGGNKNLVDVWEILYQAYQYTKDETVRDRLLSYFYYPNREEFQNKYEENAYVLKDKIYGYNLKVEKADGVILWKDNEKLYYLEENEIKYQELLKCSLNEDRKVLYVNVIPENLPKQSRYPFILYYDKKVFEKYMQVSSFREVSKNVSYVMVEEGLEQYIGQFGEAEVEVAIGFNNSEVLGRIIKAEKRFLLMEKRRTFGSLYSNYIFYVIRVREITTSIAGLMPWVVKQLKIADERGCIPVVDFSYFGNAFLEKDEIGIINPWEYYFEQPTQFSLQAAYHAQNVILGNADVDCTVEEFDALIDNEEAFKQYVEIFNKYVHINSRIAKKNIAIYENLINPGWKVLGVVYRGTDYRNRAVPGEHKQPRMDELLQMAEELMERWSCDHIFLATEDKGAVEIFKQRFGGKVVCTEKERYESTIKYSFSYKFDREFDAYLKGEEYLTEIYILSKCNCLLSSRVGILAAALPMNGGKYEEKYIYDLGLYTKEDYV